MQVVLKGGSLSPARMTLPADSRQHSQRVNGNREVYQETGEKDPATGLPIFAFKEMPDEAKAEDVADA